MTSALRRALFAIAVLAPTALEAQRGELALLGGVISGPEEEFARVYSATTVGPAEYVRARGTREIGAGVGAALTFAIRGHVFGEVGILSYGIDRTISRTANGDPDGAFVSGNTTQGRVTTFWMGPAYRVVDRERSTVSLLAAPTLLLLTGDAYNTSAVGFNAPSRHGNFGVMLGVRARHWLTERVGAQVAVEDLIWSTPLMPHQTDGTPAYPQSERKTPQLHDLRATLGVAIRLF